MEVRRQASHGFERQVRRALQSKAWSAPADGEVKVLVFDTGIASSWADAAGQLLDPAESARAARFRFPLHRERYVLSHAFWRVALGMCMSGPASAVRLEPTPLGQPRLPDSAFATSLSHSGPWAAVSVARAAVMGVDIESSASLARMDELAAFMCAPGEQAWLSRLAGGPERRQAMLRLWTRKEAILKARGEGLARSPSCLDATGDRHEASQDPAAAGAVLRVRDLEGLPGGLTGAVATPADCTAIRLHVLDPSTWRASCAAGNRGTRKHEYGQGAGAWDAAGCAAMPGAGL